MNYSGSEPSRAVESDEELIERALPLLPEIGKRLYAALGRFQQSHGLSVAQVKALGVLGQERRTVGEVAERLGVSMPAASEIVDRLVEAGYAERDVNPANRRQVLVRSTPAADTMKRELQALRRAQLRTALDRLPPAERPIFVRSLEALVDALRRDPSDTGAEWGADGGGCPIAPPTSGRTATGRS